MLSFLKVERRDYQPIFDVYVIGERYASLVCDVRSAELTSRYAWAGEDDSAF